MALYSCLLTLAVLIGLYYKNWRNIVRNCYYRVFFGDTYANRQERVSKAKFATMFTDMIQLQDVSSQSDNHDHHHNIDLQTKSQSFDSCISEKSSFGKNLQAVPFTTKITFENLSLKLKSSGKTVVDNVSGTLNVGTVTAIMGPSGMLILCLHAHTMYFFDLI